MILGFVVWSLMGLMIAGLGIHSLRSENAVGFFAGVEPPKVKDVKKYNKSVGVMGRIPCVGMRSDLRDTASVS